MGILFKDSPSETILPPISMYKRVMGVLRETFLFESHGCDIQNQRLLYLSNVPNKNLPIYRVNRRLL